MIGRLLCWLDIHLTAEIHVSENLDTVHVACIRPDCGAQWIYDVWKNTSRRYA